MPELFANSQLTFAVVFGKNNFKAFEHGFY